MDTRIHRFEGRGARFQYATLMGLYQFAFNRWLYGIFCRALARFFPQGNHVVLHLGKDRTFRVYLNDGYWTRFFLYHKDYEPEVGRVLDASAGHTNLFCDLGANSGLWSVYASTEFGKVIAVEASQATYERLLENTTKVENIVSHRMAIHNNSGETMRFVNVHNSHASAHLDLGGQKGGKDNVESVQTICIDDLVPTGCSALIKLDVEGAEVPAIDGAKRSLMEGSVFIFEDHGSDQSSEVSAHLLRIDGMRLYSIEDGCSPIEDIAQLRVLKSDRFKGYNFLAGREDSVLLSGILDSFTMHSS